ALHQPPPVATPGPMRWQPLRPGFEVAELPVIANGQEQDRILLTRVDPKLYRFVVRNDPAGSKTLDRWMRELGAVLVINGSYFAHDGTPATPVVIDGSPKGPRRYSARQGAFIDTAHGAELRDLSREDWRSVLSGADNAMVSYPLLLGAD